MVVSRKLWSGVPAGLGSAWVAMGTVCVQQEVGAVSSCWRLVVWARECPLVWGSVRWRTSFPILSCCRWLLGRSPSARKGCSAAAEGERVELAATSL